MVTGDVGRTRMSAAPPSLHIVQMLADLSLGGSQLVAVELAEACRRAGHRVTVIGGSGALDTRVEEAGARLLDWKVGKKALRTLKLVRRLRQWVRQEQPDIIHVHSRLPAWIAWLALRKLEAGERPVLVTTMHGHYSANPYSAVMARGDRVVAVSEFIRRYTLENYPKASARDLSVIYGGASESDFPYNYQPGAQWWSAVLQQHPELKDKTLLCLPSRLSRTKGHLQFISMFAPLAADDPSLHAVFVGGGRKGSSYYRMLDERISALGLEDRVTLTGPRQDMRDWMAAAAIVFNLAEDPPEAFGRTVLEGLRLGRPVIAWDHGGAAEILGRMFPQGAVPPGDIAAMTATTRRFLEQPPIVEDSKAFSLQDSMQAHLELYRDAVSCP